RKSNEASDADDASEARGEDRPVVRTPAPEPEPAVTAAAPEPTNVPEEAPAPSPAPERQVAEQAPSVPSRALVEPSAQRAGAESLDTPAVREVAPAQDDVPTQVEPAPSNTQTTPENTRRYAVQVSAFPEEAAAEQ